MENSFIMKFEMPYIEPLSFKEKEATTIANIICGSRLGELIYFGGYSNISFKDDDKQHWNPNVILMDGFTRNKANCLCFNTRKEDGKYDKIFVYTNGIRDSLYYGFLLYNTKQNKSVHIFGMTADYTNLVVRLNDIMKKNNI